MKLASILLFLQWLTYFLDTASYFFHMVSLTRLRTMKMAQWSQKRTETTCGCFSLVLYLNMAFILLLRVSYLALVTAECWVVIKSLMIKPAWKSCTSSLNLFVGSSRLKASWCKELKIHKTTTTTSRLSNGWPLADALSSWLDWLWLESFSSTFMVIY